MHIHKLTLAGLSLCATLAALLGVAATALSNLPDNRAYEMITPVEKGGELFQSEMAITDAGGEHAIVDGGPANSLLSDGSSWMLETRTATGWHGVQIGPPAQAEASYGEQSPTAVIATNQDFSRIAFQTMMSLDPRDSLPTLDVYIREGAEGPFTWITGPAAPTVKPKGETLGDYQSGECSIPLFCQSDSAYFAGASTDLSHVVFSQRAPLLTPPAALPGSPADTHAYGYEVYESANGADQLVGLIPTAGRECGLEGGACVVPHCGSAMGNALYNGNDQGVGVSEGFSPVHGAISSDGTQVIFTSPDPDTKYVAGCPTPDVYIRQNGEETIDVSGSQKTNGAGAGGTDPAGPQPKLFVGSAGEAGRLETIFFTSPEELTDDANTGSADQGNDLYAYSSNTGRLTDLTPDTNSQDPNGADVIEFLGSSTDGSLVYFTAYGALALGATAGEPNLYVRESSSGNTKFVAPGNGIQGGPIGISATPITPAGAELSSQITPDGRHLVFLSGESLTSYDQEGKRELYLYDEPHGSLTCVSCGFPGAPPLEAELPPLVAPAGYLSYPEPGTLPTSQVISDDGSSVFFSTGAQLTAEAPQPTPQPLAKHGMEPNVYEYEEGHVYLIATQSELLHTDPSGRDVYFSSNAQLTPEDDDGAPDVYDARVDGGFPVLAPPACSGASCQGVPAPPPIFATPPSVTFSGVGNFPPATTPASVATKAKHAKARRKHKHTPAKHPKRRSKRARKSHRRSDKGGK